MKESIFHCIAYKDGKKVTPTKGRELSKDIAVIHFGKEEVPDIVNSAGEALRAFSQVGQTFERVSQYDGTGQLMSISEETLLPINRGQ
jgi:hypothetical protein